MRAKLAIMMSLLLAACAGDGVTPPVEGAPSRLPTPEARADNALSKGAGKLVVWGENTARQITDAPAGTRVGALAVGGPQQGLVLREDGSLQLWGTGAVPPIPPSLVGERFESAHLSLTYLYAVRTNNSVETVGKFTDRDSTPANPPAGLRVKGIAGGGAFGVAITRNGDLETWGPGAGGITPPTGKFIRVSARSGYALALRKDGTLFGWGLFSSPLQLLGWKSDDNGHYYVPGETFAAISAGNRHIMALRADGSVVAWGPNAFRENDAPAGVRFAAIAAGFEFSLGLDQNGYIHHWGDASGGKGAVPLGRFVSIAAAARHGSAIAAEP